jgi:chromosome segregation ATPase
MDYKEIERRIEVINAKLNTYTDVPSTSIEETRNRLQKIKFMREELSFLREQLKIGSN